MRLLPCLYLLAISLNLFGQGPGDWNRGVVVLQDEAVMSGEIAYSRYPDLLLFRTIDQPSRILALPPHKISSYRFYDKRCNINRQFVCLRLERQPFKFFEVVVQGPVKIIRRLRDRSSGDEILGFHYFSWEGQSVEPIHKFRSRVYPHLLEDQPFAMEAFVTEHHLDLGLMKSAILVVKEYNRVSHLKLLASND